jgi:UDP-3-O-[3-hydroxymyristoyl] glucosamine N-acyltransferase
VLTNGHLRVGDDVRIGGNSAVHGDVLEPGDYLGYPLMTKSRWGRTLRAFDVLADVRGKLRKLSRDD